MLFCGKGGGGRIIASEKLSDLRLTLAYSHTAECCAAMREHLPKLSCLECLSILGDLVVYQAVGGAVWFPTPGAGDRHDKAGADDEAAAPEGHQARRVVLRGQPF